MFQYINMIGYFELLFVIQKFLDVQRIYNFINYLEKLYEKGLVLKDYMIFLLNCYIKLKDVEKLNMFIRKEDGIGEFKFDVEIVIRVCCVVNYYEYVMYVVKKVGKYEWYLKILFEDFGNYDEVL